MGDIRVKENMLVRGVPMLLAPVVAIYDVGGAGASGLRQQREKTIQGLRI